MSANDNPRPVLNVRVGIATPAYSTNSGSPAASVRLAGVTKWLAIYDGGLPLAGPVAFPPSHGEWAIGPDGSPCLGVLPVFTLTADVEGIDLPPSHIFRPDELAGRAVETRLDDLIRNGHLKAFPAWSATPSNPIEKLADAVSKAVQAGEFESAARLGETLAKLTEVGGAVLGMAPKEPAGLLGNRHARRADETRRRGKH